MVLQVKASDTLTSVAARFDTTPSELAKMNRLATRLVFPGQVLYVPDKRPAGSTTPPTSLDAQDSESQEDGDSTSPKPSADGDGQGEDTGNHSELETWSQCVMVVIWHLVKRASRWSSWEVRAQKTVTDNQENYFLNV